MFYNSNLYNGRRLDEQNIEYTENEIPEQYLDKVLCKSSEEMDELPDKSVHLVVTSPPYNVCKEYDEDLTLEEYLCMLKNVFKESYRVLVPGGRVCLNIANLGRKPYIPLHSHIIRLMDEIGFIMRGEIIWDKNLGGGTAWGSWKSPANPVLRDQHEYILVYSKETLSRKNPYDREITITKQEFLDYTKSIWSFSPESAKKIGHPAPFPEELPYRCIQLFTFRGEVVLDPFIGSGTTAAVSIRSDRRYVGYDINENYVDMAKKRLDKIKSQQRLDDY